MFRVQGPSGLAPGWVFSCDRYGSVYTRESVFDPVCAKSGDAVRGKVLIIAKETTNGDPVTYDYNALTVLL